MRYIHKFIETENSMVVTRGSEEEVKGSCLMGVEFHICKMKKFIDLFHNNVNIFNTIEMYT